MTPAVMRSEADLEPVSITERAAMTTSVLGRGETSPNNAGGIALDIRQVSWLAGHKSCPPSRFPSGMMNSSSPLYSRGVGCDQSALMGTPLTFPLNSWGNKAFRKPNVMQRDRMERRDKSIEPATPCILFQRKK